MQELIQNIELLLHTHNFIVVPGFGGFVAEKESSTESDGTMYPPHKAIGFNPSLTYNDGLIAQQYALTKLISFEEANRQIDNAVKELLCYLDTWRHLRFGNIGMFHLSDSGLIFEPSVSNTFLSSSYGLVPIYFPQLGTAVAVTATTEKEVATTELEVKQEEVVSRGRGIKFTPSRNWVAASVAMVLLIILFPLNVSDSKTDFAANADKASFARAVEAIAEVTQSDEATAEYHIIIGSFYSQSKAQKYISELPAQYRNNCKILFSEHRYRVSYRVFDTEAESDNFLESFSDNPRFHDAWILEVAKNNNETITVL